MAIFRDTDVWEQGWRSAESTRLPPMWPGFDSRTREFVVCSRRFSEGFSPGTPVFLPPQKPTFPNSNSTWKQWREEPLRGIHWNSHRLFILFEIARSLRWWIEIALKSPLTLTLHWFLFCKMNRSIVFYIVGNTSQVGRQDEQTSYVRSSPRYDHNWEIKNFFLVSRKL